MSERFDCSTCVYREGPHGPDRDLVICRRRSPPHMPDDAPAAERARWPATIDDDRCGEGLWPVSRGDGRIELLDWPAVHLLKLQGEREVLRLAKAQEREARTPPRGRP